MTTFIIDNDMLNFFFGEGAAYNEARGLAYLDALASQGNVQISDVVWVEATGASNSYAKDAAVENWFQTYNNNDNFQGTSTTTGAEVNAGTYTGTNAGEDSMIDMYNAQGGGSDITLLSQDGYLVNSSTYGDSVSTLPETLNTLLANQAIDPLDYLVTKAQNPTITAGWDSNAAIAQLGLEERGISATQDSSGTGVNIEPDGNPAHAIDVPSSKLIPDSSSYSDVGGLVGQSGTQAAQTDAAVGQAISNSGGATNANVGASIETLAKVGVTLMSYDISSSFATAGAEYDAGNYAGASQTLAALEGRMALGTVGAVGGGLLGVDIAGIFVTGGLLVAGSPIIAAAALVGGVALGAAGAYYGTQNGALAAQLSSTLNSINTDLAEAMADMELGFAYYLDRIESPAVANTLMALPGWVTYHLQSAWHSANSAFSPLVLDLSSGGSGLTLSSESGSGAVLWNFGDGFLHQSGFVTGTTGLLCIDPGGGPITQADLFGNEPNLGIANGVQFANGFQTLEAFASMSGGVLDASNPVFSELRVWVPSIDGSTVTTPGAGELYTLAQLGITSINLNYSNSSTSINGNQIEETSTFVINGNTQTIADAWFSYDPLNTLYDESYALNPAVLLLPDQRGYGELPELATAMSLDSTLLTEVQNLASQSFSQLMTPSFGLENAIKTILYEWAGVENVDPTSQGSYVNAQNLAFVEQLMGQTLFNEAPGTDYGSFLSGSSIGAVPWIDQTWDIALSYLSAHLLAQAGFNSLMGSPVYDPVTDNLYSPSGSADDVGVQFADEAISGTLSHLATNDIFVIFPGDAPIGSTSTTPGLTIYETPNVGTNILVLGVTPSGVTMSDDSHGNLYVNYASSDLVEILATTASNGGTTASQYLSEIAFEDGTVWNLTSGLHLTATTAFPVIYGSENGGDVLDGSQITGAHLYGYAGDETFIAGPGSSMVAGTGTNTYVINPGSCPAASSEAATISPNSHATGDQIVLHGVTESQVTVFDNSAGTLFIATSNGDEVIVNSGTNTGAGIIIGNVAGIDFDDGTVWNLQDGIHLTATSAQYIVYGTTTGGDTLDGSQITGARLIGYAGDETFIAGPSSIMTGGDGTNDFVINAGSCPSASSEGATINLNASATGDQIVLHGVTESQVQMYDNYSGTLFISTANGDFVTVDNGTNTGHGIQFAGLAGIDFDDGTVWDVSGVAPMELASYGALYGTTTGTDFIADGYSNYFHGYSGNDIFSFTSGSAPASLGGDNIFENATSGTPTIALHGITSGAVTLTDDSSGDLILTFGTDQVMLHGNYSGTTGENFGPGQITFDSGTAWNFSSGLNLTDTTYGGYLYGSVNGGDTLTADNSYDRLYAYGGNETLVAGYQSTLYNGTGNDTDVFSTGVGSVNLFANASGGSSNSIVFHGVTASQLSFSDDAYGDLMISDTSGDLITIQGGSYSSTTGFHVGNVQEIVLDNGTNVNLTGGLDLTATSVWQPLYGTGHGDVLIADGAQESLYGIAGNNTMYGEANGVTNYYGGSGNDTMIGGTGTATDYMTAGTGADTYQIESASSWTSINGFSASKGDVINLEDVLGGTNVLSNLGNYVQETTSGSNTLISVDTTGSGHFTSSLITLNGVTGLPDVATLVANHTLLVHS